MAPPVCCPNFKAFIVWVSEYIGLVGSFLLGIPESKEAKGIVGSKVEELKGWILIERCVI